MRLASDYEHLHRCATCKVQRKCYDHDCINAGGCPPPEGYVEICESCERESMDADFERWLDRRIKRAHERV